MDRIFINDLIVEGIHGLTEKERHESQRFKINVSLTTNSQAHRSDSIDDALDYRLARTAIFDVVKQNSFSLLETLAHRIADEILKQLSVFSVTVNVSKLDIWGNGTPGVEVFQMQHPNRLNLKDFSLENVFEEMLAHGAVSLPILPEERRLALLAEAQTYEYQQQPELVGGGKVREQLSSVSVFGMESLFQTLRNDFLELFLRKLTTSPIRDIFTYPLVLDEMSLQKYDAGSIGITPHMDGLSVVNIICLFILTGTSEFAVCKDRAGSHPRFFDTTPGNLILLRAPGFYHSTFRPFHFVRNITEERFVFGLRQKRS